MNILIIGGARSGKSQFAQELAVKAGKPVVFVATAEAGDEEMRQRIEEHKRNRPPTWKTLELATGVGTGILKQAGGGQVIVVDCITLLVNNIFNRCVDRASGQLDSTLVEREVAREINGLVDCFSQMNASFIVVSNDVGAGLVPADRIDRLYRDVLGKANRLLAERCDQVYLMVAGLPLQVKPPIRS